MAALWLFPRRFASCALLLGLSLGLTGCGSPTPYQTGLNHFSNRVLNDLRQNPVHAWTLYVGHGTVTTGWLWFRHRHPLVYAEVQNTSPDTVRDMVIHFGPKMITSSALSSEAGVGFYLNSSRIPQSVHIDWKVNQKTHQVTVQADDMINVSS